MAIVTSRHHADSYTNSCLAGFIASKEFCVSIKFAVGEIDGHFLCVRNIRSYLYSKIGIIFTGIQYPNHIAPNAGVFWQTAILKVSAHIASRRGLGATSVKPVANL